MIYYNLKYKYPIKAINNFVNEEKNIEYGITQQKEEQEEITQPIENETTTVKNVETSHKFSFNDFYIQLQMRFVNFFRLFFY